MFSSNTHLMLASEPTPPEVTAWQHPQIPDSYTVTIDTHDLRGHIAISGNPTQLIDLLGRMTDAVIKVATAPDQPDGQAPPSRPSRPPPELTTQHSLARSSGRQQGSGPGSRR